MTRGNQFHYCTDADECQETQTSASRKGCYRVTGSRQQDIEINSFRGSTHGNSQPQPSVNFNRSRTVDIPPAVISPHGLRRRGNIWAGCGETEFLLSASSHLRHRIPSFSPRLRSSIVSSNLRSLVSCRFAVMIQPMYWRWYDGASVSKNVAAFLLRFNLAASSGGIENSIF